MREISSLMQEQEQEDGQGKLPVCMPANPQGGWLFDILIDDIDTFSYQTKWSPNPEVMIAFAAHHDVEFELNYNESLNWLWGEGKYEKGQYLWRAVPDDDYQAVTQVAPDKWSYRGKSYDSEWEAYEDILEQQPWELRTYELSSLV